MKLVLIVWDDASILDAGPWTLRQGAPPPKATIVHQVGWLHSIEADAVVITSAVSDEVMAPRERIPIGMVKAMTELDPASGVPMSLRKKRRATPRVG